MRTCPEREVVVEIEHTKLIRKRASTRLKFCRGCKESTDFVPITKAAELFEGEPVKILDFINSNSCHFLVDSDGDIYICLADLLTAMASTIKTGTVKLLGEYL